MVNVSRFIAIGVYGMIMSPLRARRFFRRVFDQYEERAVQNDFTISYKGKRCQTEASHCQGKIRKEKITLEERLDGTLRARLNNQRFVI
jgi:hypothetical protein